MRRFVRAACAALLLAAMSPALAAAQSAAGSSPQTGTPSSTPTPSATPAASPGATPGAGGAATTGLTAPAPASAPSPVPAPVPVPDNFRNIHLGMTLDQVKSALLKDPYFNYKGPPDVSMLASPDENLIETSGYSFISRAFFQFYQKKLYIMILMLNPREISYYTMYTTLRTKYGPSTSLSPDEVVWESPRVRLSLERPLSVKYIDRSVFNRLKEAGKMKQSERSISRDSFLNQF